MGFSGKPSKGCGPCRAKRTKCDLAIPACTQCLRKNRKCTGYRNEQDLLFRDETRKAKKKSHEHAERLAASNRHAVQWIPLRQPSRRAAVDNEAISHFFAHYNEKYFSAKDSHFAEGGFDYIMPVFLQDMARGGPLPGIIQASGLAALANMKGCPDLLRAAREKQVTVLRHLNQQLQNPHVALSDSSILTCLMLAMFENIICDSPQSTQAMTYHLKGAITLAEMRGPSYFNDDISHAIYARLRGFAIAHCLQTREPLPDFILEFLVSEGMAERDYEPDYYSLMTQLCRVRSNQKKKCFVDAVMAQEAQRLMDDLGAWQPGISDWQEDPTPAPSAEAKDRIKDAQHFIWQAGVWTFNHTARILASDLVIEWAEAEAAVSPGTLVPSALEDAVHTQRMLCEELINITEYYLERFREIESAIRTTGGYALLWPLYVLSMSSTSTVDTLCWIRERAENIADAFGVRQGKMMANFVNMYI